MTPMTRNVTTTLIVLLALAADGVCAESADSTRQAIAAAAEGSHRSATNIARNAYRHPVETLSFFGLEPHMTAVEIYPGGGWYTEVLAPVLKGKGKLYAAGYDAESPVRFMRENVASFARKLAANPDVYDEVVVTELAPPHKMEIAPPGSADMVLTFRNVHNWMKAGTADQVFAAMYKALKPGGILGLVEHRGNPEVPQDPEANAGYVNQEYAIRLAEQAGFEFVGASEVNANPKDTKDYPKGVWTLPPTLAGGDADKEKYLQIGESDRMTLKFRKPPQ